MAPRSRASFQKRQKEQARQEKQRAKQQRRLEKKQGQTTAEDESREPADLADASVKPDTATGADSIQP